MQTVTIDILNAKAVKLLEDLELLQLIRLHREEVKQSKTSNLVTKYKGAMTKQSLLEVNNQLNEFRNEWD